jgi:hypothetical protein
LSVLITLAPIIGVPKTLDAAGAIFTAMGFVIGALEDEEIDVE